jgi:EmrB/QacA subfamily drug resistance transporter
MSMKTSTEKRCALVVSTLGSFLTPFMGSAVNIALPSVGKEFSADPIYLSWIVTAYVLAAAMFLVPFGKIADLYGRKRIFTYGIIIFSLASLLCALASSALTLVVFRALQGVGGSMIFGTGIAILTSVFPIGERGRVLGINVATVYAGLSIGPFLGGLLTQHLGWRSIFLVNIPLGLTILLLVFWKLKGEWAEAKGERFDVYGSVIYSTALIAAMYGFSLLPRATGAVLVLLGVLAIFVFVRWEKKIENPVLDIRLFRHNTVFALSNLAALINYSATWSVSFLLSLYLQYIKKLSPQDAGLILVSQPIIMAILSPLAGRISDRTEPRIVASMGMALTAGSLGLFVLIGDGTSLIFIVISSSLLGVGFALFSSPNTNAVMSSVEKKFYGVASGTLGTMRLVGQMFSMGIVMMVFSVYIGRVQITPEYYESFVKSLKVLFLISTLLCAGGVFASLARGKLR